MKRSSIASTTPTSALVAELSQDPTMPAKKEWGRRYKTNEYFECHYDSL
ncbi:MAG: hypothetical protein R2748_33905 [Bryobacterales bacterium]